MKCEKCKSCPIEVLCDKVDTIIDETLSFDDIHDILMAIYEKGRADVLKELREKESKHIHDIIPPVPTCKFFDVEKLTEQLKEKKNV